MKRPALSLGLSALAAALLSACSLMPSMERPAAPVPAQWPLAGSAQGVPADALAWQRFFTPARLQALQATALQNNRDLRLALLNTRQAQEQLGVRRAELWPSIGLGLSGSRTPAANGNTNTTYSAGLALSAWELDLFGRVASLGEAAAAQYLGSEEARKAAQAALLAGVAQTWLALVADEEQLALTRQTLQSREQSQELVRLRFEHGVSSELELSQAQSLTQAARATQAQLERQRAQDLHALSLLLGQPAPQDAGQGQALAALELPDLPPGVPSEVLTRRPDVRQAEHLLVAANANIGAARAAFFPRISLTAGLGLSSPQLSSLFSSGTWVFSAAPQALLTVFDAGRNQANLRLAQVGREMAVAQYERAIQSAFRDVADALAGRATYGEQLQALERQAQAEDLRLRLVSLRFANGVASSLDLLDAQRSVFAAQQAVLQLRLARLQNQVQLYRALGGGWVEETAGR